MMTHMQKRVLEFIDQRIQTTAVAPSYQEISDTLGLHSKSRVGPLIKALEQRGKLRRLPGQARAMEVVHAFKPVRQLRNPGPEAEFFVFDPEAKELVPMQTGTP